MNRGPNPLIDLLRLLLLVFLLPLILLFLGPLLVLSALRGRISLGGLQLNPGRDYRLGRLWALCLGLIVWGLTWGGLVWLWSRSPQQEVAFTQVGATPTSIGLVQAATATATSPPLPTMIPTNTSTPPATPTPTPSTNTPSPTASSTLTAIPARVTLTPPSTDVPTATATISLPQPDTETVLQTLTNANDLLAVYLAQPTIENRTALSRLWEGDAFDQAQTFANQIAVSYQTPLTITYRLTASPTITAIGDTILQTTSQELWQFEDVNRRKESLSNYEYTLQIREDSWVIIGYQFSVIRNTEVTLTVTNTLEVTSTEVISPDLTGP